MLDSLSELRLLAGGALRYRRQILALKQFFATRKCTVLLLDDLTAVDRDLQVQSIAHGVVLRIECANRRVQGFEDGFALVERAAPSLDGIPIIHCLFTNQLPLGCRVLPWNLELVVQQ